MRTNEAHPCGLSDPDPGVPHTSHLTPPQRSHRLDCQFFRFILSVSYFVFLKIKCVHSRFWLPQLHIHLRTRPCLRRRCCRQRPEGSVSPPAHGRHSGGGSHLRDLEIVPPRTLYFVASVHAIRTRCRCVWLYPGEQQSGIHASSSG